MPQFRKKPVVIEAIRWEGGDYSCLDDFCGSNWDRADASAVLWTAGKDEEEVVLWNALDQQWLLCPVGFWIIRGIRGELYQCHPEAFAATYEPVTAPNAEPGKDGAC